MQLAEKNIADRLIDRELGVQQYCQNTITEELLDILAGFEALNKPAT